MSKVPGEESPQEQETSLTSPESERAIGSPDVRESGWLRRFPESSDEKYFAPIDVDPMCSPTEVSEVSPSPTEVSEDLSSAKEDDATTFEPAIVKIRKELITSLPSTNESSSTADVLSSNIPKSFFLQSSSDEINFTQVKEPKSSPIAAEGSSLDFVETVKVIPVPNEDLQTAQESSNTNSANPKPLSLLEWITEEQKKLELSDNLEKHPENQNSPTYEQDSNATDTAAQRSTSVVNIAMDMFKESHGTDRIVEENVAVFGKALGLEKNEPYRVSESIDFELALRYAIMHLKLAFLIKDLVHISRESVSIRSDSESEPTAASKPSESSNLAHLDPQRVLTETHESDMSSSPQGSLSKQKDDFESMVLKPELILPEISISAEPAPYTSPPKVVTLDMFRDSLKSVAIPASRDKDSKISDRSVGIRSDSDPLLRPADAVPSASSVSTHMEAHLGLKITPETAKIMKEEITAGLIRGAEVAIEAIKGALRRQNLIGDDVRDLGNIPQSSTACRDQNAEEKTVTSGEHQFGNKAIDAGVKFETQSSRSFKSDSKENKSSEIQLKKSQSTPATPEKQKFLQGKSPRSNSAKTSPYSKIGFVSKSPVEDLARRLGFEDCDILIPLKQSNIGQASQDQSRSQTREENKCAVDASEKLGDTKEISPLENDRSETISKESPIQSRSEDCQKDSGSVGDLSESATESASKYLKSIADSSESGVSEGSSECVNKSTGSPVESIEKTTTFLVETPESADKPTEVVGETPESVYESPESSNTPDSADESSETTTDASGPAEMKAKNERSK